MIREVIFDIDDTLYDYVKGHNVGLKRMTDYARDELGIGEEEFLAAYQEKYRKIIDRLGTGDATIHSRSIRLLEMLESWNKPLFPHVKNLYSLYWEGLLSVSVPEEGSLEAVKTLKEMGIAVGIGTDMTLRMQLEKLERLGFAPYVDHIVTSQEAGAEKPDPSFMALCLEKAGCCPQEAAFVGDSFRKDACGSSAAGMHGIWFNKAGKERTPSDVPQDAKIYEIRSFSELVPLIKTL